MKHLDRNDDESSKVVVDLVQKHLDALFKEATDNEVCFDCAWSVLLRDAVTNGMVNGAFGNTAQEAWTHLLNVAESAFNSIAAGNIEQVHYVNKKKMI